jgi:hypothetical protein
MMISSYLILLHNYTVAKSTINCDFILDSPYHNCLEFKYTIKIAFISCTYHCGFYRCFTDDEYF